MNPQVRSLDVQLEHWNSNPSIGQAGAELLEALQAYLATPDYSQLIGRAAQSAVEQFLLAHEPTPVPPLAAPGLSPHRQMRAVDFQVHQGDTIIAGPSTESIATDWDAGGWAPTDLQATTVLPAVNDAGQPVGSERPQPASWIIRNLEDLAAMEES